MNYAEYKRAAELFSGLGIDVNSDAELARGYFILRLINSLSVESGGNCSVVHGEKFRRILVHYQVAFFMPFQSVRAETLRQIDSLCTLLQQNALFADRSFFVEFSPWIVADWDGYTNLFMEEKFGGKQLIILLKQLEWHEKYVPGQADFSFDPAAFYQTHSDIIAYWETNFKSSEKLFCNSWNTIFRCKCTTAASTRAANSSARWGSSGRSSRSSKCSREPVLKTQSIELRRRRGRTLRPSVVHKGWHAEDLRGQGHLASRRFGFLHDRGGAKHDTFLQGRRHSVRGSLHNARARPIEACLPYHHGGRAFGGLHV